MFHHGERYTSRDVQVSRLNHGLYLHEASELLDVPEEELSEECVVCWMVHSRVTGELLGACALEADDEQAHIIAHAGENEQCEEMAVEAGRDWAERQDLEVDEND